MNPDLKSEVEMLIDEVERTHRYSMSRIYALWNTVNEKSETPQSCASCLIRKVRDLKLWLAKQEPKAMPIEAQPIVVKKAKRVRKKAENG